MKSILSERMPEDYKIEINRYIKTIKYKLNNQFDFEYID